MKRLAALLVLAALAGCGPGGGDESEAPQDVNVLITRDYGATEIRDSEISSLPAGETVMRLLERRYDVETTYGGRYVQSLEGLSGGEDRDGDSVDWFLYVNGLESGRGAADVDVQSGDRIWWDRHDWDFAQRVPAVVGSWPEPFLLGEGGKRLPLTIVCAGEERSCDEVQARLAEAGVEDVAQSSIGTNTGAKVLRVLVGPWEAIRADPAAQQLEEGPQTSGVFAIPGPGSLDLLSDDGEVVQSLDEAGLVAATRFGEQQATWVVTGTDDAGVAAAAAALREDELAGRFAVAVVEGRGVALPVVPPEVESE